MGATDRQTAPMGTTGGLSKQGRGRRGTGTIEARGPRVWRIEVSVGTDPATGKRKRIRETVHGTKEDAQRRLAEIAVAYNSGVVETSSATVAQLVRDWIASAPVAETTRQVHATTARLHILGHRLGTMRADRLTVAEIEAHYRALAKQGVGPHAIVRVHGILSRSFARAVRHRVVRVNIIRDAVAPTIRQPPPSAPDTDAVRATIENADPDTATFLRILAATGARRSEVAALQWADIDQRVATIRIARATAIVAGRVIVKETKTDRERTVSVTPRLLELLTEHRKVAAVISPWLFPSIADPRQPRRPDALTKAVARAADGRQVTARALRHYAATTMLASGVDPRTGADRLGHSRVSTFLDRYTASSPARDRAAAEILDRDLGMA